MSRGASPVIGVIFMVFLTIVFTLIVAGFLEVLGIL